MKYFISKEVHRFSSDFIPKELADAIIGLCESARTDDDPMLEIDTGARNDGETMIAAYIDNIPKKISRAAIEDLISDYKSAIVVPANYKKYNRFRSSIDRSMKRDKELIIENLYELDKEEAINRLKRIDRYTGYRSL